MEHRGELLTAVFTIIRAWQVAGRPKKSTSFGSFERWEAVVGGAIANADVDGFLANLRGHRESADYDEGLWVAHCAWLTRTFPQGTFTTNRVVQRLAPRSGHVRIVDSSADLPPWVDGSPVDAGYAARLGRLYNDRHDCWFGGYRIRKGSSKTDNKVTWILEVSPRILQEQVDADAAEKARAAAAKLDQLARDLPDQKTQLADLQAENAGQEESLEMKHLQLEIENAELAIAQNGPAPSTQPTDASTNITSASGPRYDHPSGSSIQFMGCDTR